MARIENLRLADAGRRRNATFTVRGTIIWEAAEASRNEMEIRVSFFGQDRRDDDRLANNVDVWCDFQLVGNSTETHRADRRTRRQPARRAIRSSSPASRNP